jgi:hypothetical protein
MKRQMHWISGTERTGTEQRIEKHLIEGERDVIFSKSLPLRGERMPARGLSGLEARGLQAAFFGSRRPKRL